MLTRWEPFHGIRQRGRDMFSELTGMQQEMNRVFDEFFGERQDDMAQCTWTPMVDVSETDAELKIRAELPGLTQENIEIHLQDNVLTLQGEKKQEQKEERENFHRVERCYGTFSRSFTLPATVKIDAIQATFKNGILLITLPKAEEAKSKKIEIATGA